MKDRSLLHLLLARLRQLAWHASSGEREFVENLQNNLKVEQDGDWFLISWRWQNKEHELNVPGAAFQFYGRGDVAQQPTRRGGRLKNWQQAEDVLRRIAEISGAGLPADRRPGSLNTIVSERVDRSSRQHLLIVVPGLLAGFLAFALTQFEIGVWTGVAAIALSYLTQLI